MVTFTAYSSFSTTFEISGLEKTKEHVVQTEINLCDSECSSGDLNILKQKLLKTGLFYAVEIEKIDSNRVKINLKEKWTTIPILKFNSGGGTTQLTVGVYDPNLFGHRVESGLQYEQLGNAPSFVVWNKIPRFLDTCFFSDFQYWKTKRIRLKYNPDLDEPTLFKAFLLDSEKIYFAFGYEFNSDLRLSLLLENQKDRFSTDLISAETLAKVSGQSLPNDTDVFFTGLQLEQGVLVQEAGLQIGTQYTGNIKYGQPVKGDPFFNLRLDLNHYSLFQDDWLFAQRLRLGSTDTNILQFWNYLGGLDSIRGFADNRFATKNYWLSNSEIRKYVIEKPSWILQGVGFVDAIGIDESTKKIDKIAAASMGLGFRFIMPKIYRLVLRFDFAKPILNSDKENVSFGIQQFF